MRKKYKQKLKKTNKELDKLKKEYNEITNNLKSNDYPKGGVFYIMNTNKEDVLKIGISNNMKKRCNTYNTSFVNNVKVLYCKKVACPIEVELCVKSLLHKYRYRDKREFYTCNIDKIKDVLKKCLKVLKENNCDLKCNYQKGGHNLILNTCDLLNKKIVRYNKNCDR